MIGAARGDRRMRRVRDQCQRRVQGGVGRGEGGFLGLDLGREPLHLVDPRAARLAAEAGNLFGRPLLRRAQLLNAVQVLTPSPVEGEHPIYKARVEPALRHRSAEEVRLFAQQLEIDHEWASARIGYRRAAVSRTCRAANRPALVSTGCPTSLRERPSASRPVSSHSGSM